MGLFEALRYSVETDVGMFDSLKYAHFGLKLSESGVKGMVLGEPALRHGWRQNMAVFLVDWRQIANELAECLRPSAPGRYEHGPQPEPATAE